MINLAQAETPPGKPVMSDERAGRVRRRLRVSGFTPGINWYRNLDRNWQLMEGVDPIVRQQALMVYGARDTVMRAPRLESFVPHVDVAELDCGHWIQQELPEETTHLIVEWLQRQSAAHQP